MGKYVLGFFMSVVILAVYAYILMPSIVVVISSFGERFYLEFPPTGFTFKWYEQAFGSPEIRNALLVSLKIAFGAASIAVVLGSLAALGLAKGVFPGRDFLSSIYLWPLMVPNLVLGVALLTFSASFGIRPSSERLMVAHAIVAIPYVMRAALPAFEKVKLVLEEAARDLGSTGSAVFWHVTVPIARTGLLVAFFLALIQSMDELNVALFLSAPREPTLPIIFFRMIDFNLDPTVAAASTIIITLIFVGLLLFQFGASISERLFRKRT